MPATDARALLAPPARSIWGTSLVGLGPLKTASGHHASVELPRPSTGSALVSNEDTPQRRSILQAVHCSWRGIPPDLLPPARVQDIVNAAVRVVTGVDVGAVSTKCAQCAMKPSRQQPPDSPTYLLHRVRAPASASLASHRGATRFACQHPQ